MNANELNMNFNEKLLRKHKITYNKKFFQSEMNITMMDSSRDSQVMILAVYFSNFMVEITVLNLIEESKSPENFELIGYGAYSKVYLADDPQIGKHVIKSVAYRTEKQKQKESKEEQTKIQHSLSRLIFEFCLSKLFSALRIGPQVMRKMGFDLVIYANTVEFCLEQCTFAHLEHLERDLPSSLQMMHQMRIVHGDIKPENIMWSPQFQKNVFLDFGLSRLLKETMGSKTVTTFSGTYRFCCDEMKNLFGTGKSALVDLYFNDIYGLNESVKAFPEIIKKDIPKNQKVELQSWWKDFLKNNELKALIYELN